MAAYSDHDGRLDVFLSVPRLLEDPIYKVILINR